MVDRTARAPATPARSVAGVAAGWPLTGARRSRRTLLVLTLAWVVVAALPEPGQARPSAGVVGAMHAAEAQVRPAARGQRELEVALRLENRGPTVDQLLAAASPLARAVAIVAPPVTRRGGALPPVEGLMVMPGQILVLGPGAGGAARLVMKDLLRPLRVGEVFPLELSFQRAGRLAVSVQVLDGTGTRALPGPARVKDCQMPDATPGRMAGLC